MTFQNGDIILIKVNKFSAWYRALFGYAIRLIDGVYYHHAQIYFGGYLYEADTQVKQQIFSRNDGDEILVMRLNEPLNFKETNKLNVLIAESIGKKYDYWGALLHQLIFIMLFRRVWIGRKGNSADRKLYCTEFVTSLMFHTRGYFPEHYKIGPSKLIQLLPLYYKTVFEGTYKNDYK